MHTVLCGLDALPGGPAVSRGVDVALPGGTRRLLLVRRGDRLFAYQNRCPHTGSPLDWVPHQFLDGEGRLLVCATHGARFRIEDGHCIAGPCAGKALRSVPVEVIGGEVVARTVDLEALRP